MLMTSDAIPSFIAIVVMIYSGVHLSTSEIFTMTTIFAYLSHSIFNDLEYGYRNVQEGLVSISRIEEFLEGSPDTTQHISKVSHYAV